MNFMHLKKKKIFLEFWKFWLKFVFAFKRDFKICTGNVSVFLRGKYIALEILSKIR